MVFDFVIREVSVRASWVLSPFITNLEPIHLLIEEDLEGKVVEVLANQGHVRYDVPVMDDSPNRRNSQLNKR